uniref:Uncharacterized protein n=1 Tax=Setaria viridis TaxID=4556 RepID=A0A4U6VI98_SETVI|nr:hypothetical protein SEVIR_3G318206v2 [Setaria viridis]
MINVGFGLSCLFCLPFSFWSSASNMSTSLCSVPNFV